VRAIGRAWQTGLRSVRDNPSRAGRRAPARDEIRADDVQEVTRRERDGVLVTTQTAGAPAANVRDFGGDRLRGIDPGTGR